MPFFLPKNYLTLPTPSTLKNECSQVVEKHHPEWNFLWYLENKFFTFYMDLSPYDKNGHQYCAFLFDTWE